MCARVCVCGWRPGQELTGEARRRWAATGTEKATGTGRRQGRRRGMETYGGGGRRCRGEEATEIFVSVVYIGGAFSTGLCHQPVLKASFASPSGGKRPPLVPGGGTNRY